MATPGFQSGTYNNGAPGGGPLISELVLDAYERIGKIGVELTSLYVQSARRSLNLVLSAVANLGINLWTVTEFVQYAPQGVATYTFLPQIVDILADSVILRQYLMGSPVSVAPDFTTTSGSKSVTVSGLGATPGAGQYISVGVMTTIGGIVLDGFYQVDSVPGSGQATITAASAATSNATGGAVPQFVSTQGSSTITVNFANHGLAVGQPFNVEISTSVGGVTLLGPYPVATVASANQFTFTAPYPAGSSQTASENNGDVSLATQSTADSSTSNSYPVDIQLFPLSRTDYYVIPNKSTQGRPTSFWNDRQISPVINLWPVPDGNGPYEVRFRASRQIQDADISSGQTLNAPFRMIEPITAMLATHLAQKWAPDRYPGLKAYSDSLWSAAAAEDSERVSLYLSPDLMGYFAG